MTEVSNVEFRIRHPFDDTYQGLGNLQYRAGFEDWDAPGAFVIQLEEALGYDEDGGTVLWSPIARFDHLRPHDVFDPADGLHIDLYRREEQGYTHLDLGVHLEPRDPLAAFTRLQRVFESEQNRQALVAYYVDDRSRFAPEDLRL